MKADITTDHVARSLYLNGPAGLQTLAADLERRNLLDRVNLPKALEALVADGHAAVRTVVMAGQTVQLFYLAGNGVG